jgi:voltage-gated potassium channel
MLNSSMLDHGAKSMTEIAKQRLYHILERGRPEDSISRIIDWTLIVLIVANVGAAIAGTVEPLYERHKDAFWVFEVFSVAIFTVEYLCRLWVCTEHLALSGQGPIKARLKFFFSPYALIDLLAILPFYVALFVPTADLRFLRVFRLLRLLKLARYSPALATLWQVLVNERRALAAALLILIILLITASTAIYHVERVAQPESFGSIPATMWWAIATLTTVGYGDVVPVTGLGRAIGGLVMISGLAMFALPVGIIASGFATEIHRRDFVVTWGMVARVPMFAKLDALSVSRITNLLSARVVPPETTIFRRGDPPDAMYFIASGEVEVDLNPEPLRLREGDFFGEIALLRDTPRSATIRAVTQCRLLVLDKEDFKDLLESDTELRQAIVAVAEERLTQ